MTASRDDSRRQQLVRIAFELQAGHRAGEERKADDAALPVAATATDVAEVAVFMASFPSNALTGQSVVVSHGWHMD
jgi:enoyl-[acyl-carrier-protein] reductase (NADH)